MNDTQRPLADLIDERVNRDLRETLKMNLAMVGVVITDAQLDGLVSVVVMRLDGELRLRRLMTESDRARSKVEAR